MMVDYGKNEGFGGTKGSGSLLAGYNACLDTWSRAFCKEAAKHCQDILHTMMDDKVVIPDTVTFNTCLYGTG